MHAKLIACAAALVAVGGTWAYSNYAVKSDCWSPGSTCCFPGSPCCDDCCPGSPCCDPGSPCCVATGCCDQGLPCCEPASDCCLTAKAAPKAGETATGCFAATPAGDCCAK